MKRQVNIRVSEATRAKLDWLAKCYGTQAEAVAVAIDRLYNAERSTMTRMSYEAEPEEIDEVVLARARAVHAEVCGCDNKRCNLTNDVYQWLMVGDKGEGATTEALVEEWRAFNAGYPDGDPYERFYEVGDPTVLAAHMILSYTGPQYHIALHPNAEASDADDLAAINAADIDVLEANLMGWGEYNAVIRVTDDAGLKADYLARLA